jgi:uncharacterized membrane protein YdjX (TVP38/TMEM64 family)
MGFPLGGPVIKKYPAIKAALLIVLIAGLFVLNRYLDISSYFSPERIRRILEGTGPMAPLIYMGVMAMAVVVSPIPSVPLDIAAGAFFGPWLGTFYSALGALGGAVVSFFIARLLGRRFIERFLGGHVNFCTYCSDRVLTKVVFLARLMPGVSFDIVSYGAGLTKMSVRNFSLATFFGSLLPTFFYNYFGSVFVIGKELAIAVGIFFVILFFLLPRWIEKKGIMKMPRHEEDDGP